MNCKNVSKKKKGNIRTLKTNNKRFNFRIIPNGKCTLKNMKNISNKLKFLKNSRYSIKTYHKNLHTLDKNKYIEITLFDDCNVPCFLQISLQKTHEDKRNVLLVNIFNQDTPEAKPYLDSERMLKCDSAFYNCLNKQKGDTKNISNKFIQQCHIQINKYCNTPNLITKKTNISRKRFSHSFPVRSSGLYLDGNTIKKSVLLDTYQKKIVNIILSKIVPQSKRVSKSGTTSFENNYNFFYNESGAITREYVGDEYIDDEKKYKKTLLNFSKFITLFKKHPADLYSAINSDNLVDDYGNEMISGKEIENWKKTGNLKNDTISKIEGFITDLEERVVRPPPTTPIPLPSPPRPFNRTRKSRNPPIYTK
tara:strand:- start:6099 stop:7193 length:1095 start_codon:yes stop_codon:yes gene_type:complete